MSHHELFTQAKRSIRQNLIHLKHQYKGIQPIHFLHIGKTGGTAFREAAKNHLVTKKYNIHLHGHNYSLRDVPVGEKAFFFLRDPIDRYVSGFYSRQRKGRYHNNPWRPDEEVSFKKFESPQALALALASKDEKQYLSAKYAMESIGHVKSSYWDWFENESYFMSRLPDIFYIGFQETLNQDFECLKQRLQLPEPVELPKDPVKANRSSKAKRAVELSDIERQALQEWYADDYAFFNLCKQLIDSEKI
ncbi:MAG: sulfotransferase family 2 domain-containing protein [Phormidesmis sp.]